MFNQQKYIEEYKRDKYQQIPILMAKGTKPLLKAIAKNKGVSLNTLILGAVEKKFRLDIAPNKKQNNNT